MQIAHVEYVLFNVLLAATILWNALIYYFYRVARKRQPEIWEKYVGVKKVPTIANGYRMFVGILKSNEKLTARFVVFLIGYLGIYFILFVSLFILMHCH